jgi:hypothetical protein
MKHLIQREGWIYLEFLPELLEDCVADTKSSASSEGQLSK